jgi:hypothetical protein
MWSSPGPSGNGSSASCHPCPQQGWHGHGALAPHPPTAPYARMPIFGAFCGTATAPGHHWSFVLLAGAWSSARRRRSPAPCSSWARMSSVSGCEPRHVQNSRMMRSSTSCGVDGGQQQQSATVPGAAGAPVQIRSSRSVSCSHEVRTCTACCSSSGIGKAAPSSRTTAFSCRRS